MSESSLAGMCRLTIQLTTQKVELAVPADIPLADLLPALLGFAGTEAEETSVEGQGWGLQRLGEAPLDEEATLASLGIRDGETLYLRSRAEALPEAHFDDIVDGVATVMGRLGGDWTESTSRFFARGVAALLLAAVALVLTLPGPSGVDRGIAAALCGVLVLAGAATASRAVGDSFTAVMLGCLAVPFLGMAGWLVPGGPSDGGLMASHLLSAGAAAAGCAVLALAVVGSSAAVFLSVALVAAFAAVAGGLSMLMDSPASDIAALISVLAVILGGFVPALSFRLAGMQMRPLPTTPGELQESIEPHPSGDVATRAESANAWMTALYAATGLVCTICVTVLAQHFGVAEAATGAVLTALLLLHGRNLGSTRQRLSILLPGVWGVGVLSLALAHSLGNVGRFALVLALVTLAIALTIAVWTVPGRRLVPYWGRAAEILHLVMALALPPLALWVVGVYAKARQLTS
ncbi:type VII secretion integral membrane protein EccD [Streptomyces sp. NPDC048297]|uniref:type VII secretion integral membrane protein EccD n=1 Tax=Streptomyces sp. NPDC048297 TaxID=3365531 RepID=UPI0037222D4A